MTVAAGASTPAAEGPLRSWRYVWRMHRFRPARQYVNLAGVFLGWGTELLPGLAAKIVFDHLDRPLAGGALGWLLWPLAIVAARAASLVVTAFTLQATNGAFSYANAAMLQRNMLRRILDLPGGRALAASPGETVSRFRDDTEAVIWYPIGINNVIGWTVTGAIAAVVMFRISPAVTLGAFVPLAVVILLVEAARNRITAYRLANHQRTSEVTGFIGDVFAAAQTVQVANAEDRVVEQFRQLNGRRRHAAVRDRLLDEFLRGTFWVVNLGTGVVLLFAGRSMASGDFSVGDLALFVSFLKVFEEFVIAVGDAFAGYKYLGVSFRRMHELLAGRPARDLVADDDIFELGPLPSATPPPVLVEPFRELRVEHLAYRHGDGSIGLENVSLTVPAGSFTVVTGRVGSGKTTLLQAILGLVPATGTITWNGAVVDDPATFLVPPRTAYTPQVPRLFSDTLAGNVLLGVDGGEALDEALRLAVLEADVAAMPDGLDTRIGSRGLRLSGGQLQRAAAARMFVRRPQLLACDDLSSALDVETEAALWERVLDDRSRAVLAVSHRRAAMRLADQVVVMKDGRVDDVGTVDELLERCEELRLLWRLEPTA